MPAVLRLTIIIALAVFDILVLKYQYETFGRFPFSLPTPIQEQIDQVFPTPLATPKPLATGIELSEGQWIGSIVYGKLTNHNEVTIEYPTLYFALSDSEDSTGYIAGYTATVAARLLPDESVYFSQRFTVPKNQSFWWTSVITTAASDSGTPLKRVPTGQRVSRTPISIPSVRQTVSDTTPWGVAKQIDDVTWTIRLGEDERIATPAETYTALNEYRNRHGSPRLEWDERLAAYATERARHLNSLKSTDQHKGFREYTANEENVRALGFWSLGENSGYGHKLLGVHLIEWVYAGDPDHNANQLSKTWSHVGIGIDGLAVVFIFGGNKI